LSRKLLFGVIHLGEPLPVQLSQKEGVFALLRMTLDGVANLNPSVVTLNEVKSLRVNSVKDLELK
jgi:hypothetical protein